MKPSTQFSVELQSMRGCAAMVVLLGHCFETYRLPAGMLKTFLILFLNGRGAVTFFFVLSGAVIALSLQTFSLSLPSYTRYLIRRLLRILPLILVASVIGSIFCNFIDQKAYYLFATDWFTKCYKLRVEASHFIASLVGYSARPNPPLWSIFVELVGSVLLPLMVITIKCRWKMILVGIVLLVISFLPMTAFKYYWPVFLITFYAGVSVLSWGSEFAMRINRIPGLAITLIVACASLFFLNRHYIWIGREHGDPLTNMIEILAVAPIIALILYTPRRFGPLQARPLVFLGNISFSLYVLHFPILGIVVQLLARAVPQQTISAYPALYMFLTMLIVAGCGILLSIQTYRWIELPFAKIGKDFAKKM